MQQIWERIKYETINWQIYEIWGRIFSQAGFEVEVWRILCLAQYSVSQLQGVTAYKGVVNWNLGVPPNIEFL